MNVHIPLRTYSLPKILYFERGIRDLKSLTHFKIKSLSLCSLQTERVPDMSIDTLKFHTVEETS